MVPEEAKPEPILDNVPIPELADQVVRGKVKLTPMQQRMLIEMLLFYIPKLTAVGISHFTGEDFAVKLERAIARTNGARVPKLIEAQAVEVD